MPFEHCIYIKVPFFASKENNIRFASSFFNSQRQFVSYNPVHSNIPCQSGYVAHQHTAGGLQTHSKVQILVSQISQRLTALNKDSKGRRSLNGWIQSESIRLMIFCFLSLCLVLSICGFIISESFRYNNSNTVSKTALSSIVRV